MLAKLSMQAKLHLN